MFKVHYPIEPILVTALLITAAILQMINFIEDERTPNADASKRYTAIWHATGGIFRVATCWVLGRAYGWEYSYAALVLTWIWFDGAINAWVLRKEWFYVGTTALTDRVLRWAGKKLRLDPRTLNATIKALAVVILIIYLIKKAWN